MAALLYGKAAYKRLAGRFPELRLVNMFVESSPTAEQSVALLSRPGLDPLYVAGSGPVRGLFTEPGALGGSVFALSGGALYRDQTSLGSIVGGGVARFAASASELLVTGGEKLYQTEGGAPVLAGFPDNADVLSVVLVAGLFVAVRAGTQRFYWSGVLDGTMWDGLDYAAAESSPDDLLDIVVVGDVIWLLGETTIEPWQVTGAADLPFSRVEGRNYQRGVYATGCACELDNTLFWVGEDGQVYRGGAVPERLSDHGIEERIARSTNVRVFAFSHEGHKMFGLRLDVGTYLYDVATQQWCEFESLNRPNWRVLSAAQQGKTALVGDDQTGQIYTLASDRYDDNGVAMQRVFTAYAPVKKAASIDVVTIDADFGSTPVLAGQGSEPVIEMRQSRDAGRTFTPWRQSSLGRLGQYRAQSVWRRLGMFDSPGAMLEFRVTDPVPFRLSNVEVNEAQGGRSRN